MSEDSIYKIKTPAEEPKNFYSFFWRALEAYLLIFAVLTHLVSIIFFSWFVSLKMLEVLK